MISEQMDRLKFHLQDGVFRGWSRWYPEKYNESMSEEELAQDERAGIFKHWRSFENNPHPLDTFEKWPYHLILDLCRYTFKTEEEYADLLIGPDDLLERIVELAEEIYSTNPQWASNPPKSTSTDSPTTPAP